MADGCSFCISKVTNTWRWTSGCQLCWKGMPCGCCSTHLAMKVPGSTFSHSTNCDQLETQYVLMLISIWEYILKVFVRF